jgi:hypothetical protein
MALAVIPLLVEHLGKEKYECLALSEGKFGRRNVWSLEQPTDVPEGDRV